MALTIINGMAIALAAVVSFALGASNNPVAPQLIFLIVFAAFLWFKDNRKNNHRIDNEKLIDDLKTIVAVTTDASSEGDLDGALRSYFEKKSVVKNTVETPN